MKNSVLLWLLLLISTDASLSPAVKVTHSCDATPIEYNVTLKMGLHSGVFQKIGRVDAMDDCIEMSCKQPNSDVAFMLGSMCYAVHCYSADLCKTVPIFGSSISRLNLNPAISFLKKSRFGVSSLGKFQPLCTLFAIVASRCVHDIVLLTLKWEDNLSMNIFFHEVNFLPRVHYQLLASVFRETAFLLVS